MRQSNAMPAYEMAQKLFAVDASSSEWYLYAYLIGLAAAQQANPITTTATAMLRSDEYPVIKMHVRTLLAAIEALEDKGLINVTRTTKGIAVELTIKLE